jgi:hypothetical protein
MAAAVLLASSSPCWAASAWCRASAAGSCSLKAPRPGTVLAAVSRPASSLSSVCGNQAAHDRCRSTSVSYSI